MKKRSIRKWMVLLFLLIPTGVSIYQSQRSSPDGVSVAGDTYHTDYLEFLYDLTYENEEGNIVSEKMIFDRIDQMIEDAEEFIVIDMFLFNDAYNDTDPNLNFPSLSMDVSDTLVQKKETHPEVDIVFITDPLNTFYGAHFSDALTQMREVGIEVVVTDLHQLRDSNPIYSGFYRSYVQWFGNSENSGWLPNIFGPNEAKLTIRSYLNLLNFKANHRKTVMNEQEALIASANLHDASFYHSNVAYVVRGDILNDLLETERTVVDFSGYDTTAIDSFKARIQTDDSSDENEQDSVSVQLLTEEKIKDSLLETIHSSEAQEILRLGLFYLADREIVEALSAAANRNVVVELILDQNIDAFGQRKIGIPNRQVADELTRSNPSLQVRWYETNGEQFHAKFLMHEKEDTMTVIGGSANFTRRNLDDFNLETNIKIEAAMNHPEIQKMTDYWHRIWDNQEGTYTSDYDTHAESIWWKNVLYHIQERTGLSSF